MKKSLLLAALIVGVVSVVMNPLAATGNHEPADKASAAASDIDTVDDTEVILQQKMRVSSTSDLILQTTAECSILTSLFNPGSATGGAEDTQSAFGQVEFFITLDGERVPVSTDDEATGEDRGKVVFCNRAYTRKIADTEENEGGPTTGGDGYDQEDDFIRTRNANGFNWMAFDVGKEYDVGNDNIIDIQLHAEYDRRPNQCDGDRQADDALTPYGETCADALVGSRTLIVEAVHASNHEQPDPAGE
jgi:hypothetical protein